MGLEFCSSSERLAMAGLLVVAAWAPLACGPLLGIDDGLAKGDAAAGARDEVAIDATRASGADPEASEVGLPDARDQSDPIADVDSRVAADAGCTPDPNWCNAHCGTGPDNCGLTRECSSTCPVEQACGANLMCACQVRADWCNGRCEDTTDNCGNPIGCGLCDGGVPCYSNVCGCMPEPAATACGASQCGQATNNCNLTVNCGVDGSAACPQNQVCLAGPRTCCTPDNAAACGNRCQVQVTNNCDVTFVCPACATGQVCDNGQCCKPVGCGGTCVDNCGQTSQACCPTPPPDAGSPPPEDGGGACTPMGSPCAGNAACCTGSCSSAGTCVSACGTLDVACSSTSSCCYGLTCKPFISPAAQTVSGEAPQLVGTGRCQ